MGLIFEARHQPYHRSAGRCLDESDGLDLFRDASKSHVSEHLPSGFMCSTQKISVELVMQGKYVVFGAHRSVLHGIKKKKNKSGIYST